MSKDLIKGQKEALVKRAEGLAANLKRDLESVEDYDKTIPIVRNYIGDVMDEFSEYVKVVKKSRNNPGRPCREDEIWCLPIMDCATEGQCRQYYGD